MKCQDNMYKTKKAPQKKSLPKDIDFSKMTKVGNENERSSVDQQARKYKKKK